MINNQLNKNDKVILSALGRNSRVSLNELSKKAHISKQAISKKIKNLEDKMINSYVTHINYFKIGYNNFYLFLKIQGLKKDNLLQKINQIRNLEGVVWISRYIGEYDLGISIFYKDLEEFYFFLNKVYKIFGRSITKREAHQIYSQKINPLIFEGSRSPIISIDYGKPIEISRTEERILEEIQKNSRQSFLELSEKIGIDHRTLRRLLKRLEKEKIILGYGLFLNYKELELTWNTCIINIISGSNIDKVLRELSKNNEISFISITLENKIILDYIGKDYNSLKTFFDNLIDQFPEEIGDYQILNVSDLVKLD